MRLLRLVLLVVLATVGYAACSDDDYGHSFGGDDAGDASANEDLAVHD